MTRPSQEPGVLFFSMPFAAPASHKHAEKMIDCLAPICRHVAVVGDRRIDLRGRPEHIVRQGRIPTLHYLAAVRPQPWSALLWVLKLLWIVLRAAWAVVEARRRIDVVICFQGTYYAPILLCARLLGKKTISFEPGNDIVFAQKTYRGRGGRALVRGMELLRDLTRRLAHICAIESLCLVDQIQLWPHLGKLRLGNLHVDTDRYRTTTPLNKRRPVVGFMGRLAAAKGVPALLDAAAALHGRGISIRLIGDGPLRDEVAAAIRHPGLSHVELLGWAGDDTVVARLNEFALMVLPTELEGMPNAVLEAMACGTPVLATAVGGIPDVITHGVTGFILPDRDPNTIAHAIVSALAHPDRAVIARRGQQLVTQRYSLAASAEKWRRILDELKEP